MHEINFIWRKWPFMQGPAVTLPCFTLRVVTIPSDAKEIRKHIHWSNIPDSMNDYALNQAIKKLNEDRNMHVVCPWDTRINLVRNRNINILKRAACLDDYRRVYPTNKRILFIYNLSELLLLNLQLQFMDRRFIN